MKGCLLSIHEFWLHCCKMHAFTEDFLKVCDQNYQSRITKTSKNLRPYHAGLESANVGQNSSFCGQVSNYSLLKYFPLRYGNFTGNQNASIISVFKLIFPRFQKFFCFFAKSFLFFKLLCLKMSFIGQIINFQTQTYVYEF